MLYTEEILTKYSRPMSETTCEMVYEIFKQKLKKLLSKGFHQDSDIIRHAPDAAYYSVSLISKNEDNYTLMAADSFALNIIGPLDKEPDITLLPAADSVFHTLYKEINKKNRDTNYAFKKLVRILKHIHADMVKAKIHEAELVTADDIIVLAQQIPNDIYIRFDTLSDKLRYILLQDTLHFSNSTYGTLLIAMREFVEVEEN